MAFLSFDTKFFLKVCISNAKIFLQENPNRKTVYTAEMFKVYHSTLYKFLYTIKSLFLSQNK